VVLRETQEKHTSCVCLFRRGVLPEKMEDVCTLGCGSGLHALSIGWALDKVRETRTDVEAALHTCFVCDRVFELAFRVACWVNLALTTGDSATPHAMVVRILHFRSF